MTKKQAAAAPRPLLDELERPIPERERIDMVRALTPERLGLSPARAATLRDLLFKVHGLSKSAGHWSGREATLARFLGRSVKTVSRYVAQGERLGLLLVARRSGWPSAYRVDWAGVIRAGERPERAPAIDWAAIRAARDRGQPRTQPRTQPGTQPGTTPGQNARGPRTKCPRSPDKMTGQEPQPKIPRPQPGRTWRRRWRAWGWERSGSRSPRRPPTGRRPPRRWT